MMITEIFCFMFLSWRENLTGGVAAAPALSRRRLVQSPGGRSKAGSPACVMGAMYKIGLPGLNVV